MFEPGRLEDDDGQPVQDHVAADLGRRLRQPEAQERAVPEDGEGAPPGRVAGSPVSSAAARSRRPSPADPAGRCHAPRSGRDRRARRSRRSAARAVGRSSRTCRPQPGQRSPMSAPSRSTSQVSPPHGCGRRRRTTSPRNSVEHGVGRSSAGQGIRAGDGRCPGRGPGSSPAARGDPSGVTVRTTSAGSRQLGDDAARRGSASRSASPARRSRRCSNGSPSGVPSTRIVARRAGRRRRPGRRRRRRPRSPRRRRCAAR